MTRTRTRAMLFAALTVLGSQHAIAQAGDFAVPTLDVGGGKYLKDSKTIVIPTYNLHLSVEGSASAKGNSGGANAQAHGKYVVKGIDKAWAQGLARQVQEDLVTRLKAIGYTVLTYDDIKDEESVVKMGRYKMDKEYGLPKNGWRATGVDYLMATPSDGQVFDPPIQGPHWPFRGIAKARNAIVLVPEIWILAPQMWGEKETGYKRVSATMNIAPGMNAQRFFGWFINPKAAGGALQTKGELANLTENSGTLSELGKDGFDVGFLKSATSAWKMTVDPASYSAGVMRGAVAINKAMVEAIQKETR